LALEQDLAGGNRLHSAGEDVYLLKNAVADAMLPVAIPVRKELIE